MFNESKRQTGCLICKSALGDSPGPFCGECMGTMAKRTQRQQKRSRLPEPEEGEESTGLSALENVIQSDNAKIERQAKNRAARTAVSTPKTGEPEE